MVRTCLWHQRNRLNFTKFNLFILAIEAIKLTIEVLIKPHTNREPVGV